MTEKIKFRATFIISIIGALAWLSPLLINNLSCNRIHGKVISIYHNFNEDQTKTMLLFKISVVSENKDFLLSDIDLRIKFQSGDIIKSASRNARNIIFTYDSIPKKLLVRDNEFINNFSILKKDTPVVGYLFFCFDFNKDVDFDEIEFIFNSYKNKKRKRLDFKNKRNIFKEKLSFDDTIWEEID